MIFADRVTTASGYDGHFKGHRKSLGNKYEPCSKVRYLMERHLSRIVTQNETLKKDKKQCEPIVMNNIQSLNQYFQNNAEFKRQFEIRFELSGSMADGTKVGDALEFDYLVVLRPKKTAKIIFEASSFG